MTTSTGYRAEADGYEAVQVPGRTVPARHAPAMFRRRSVQPSRRAVLHVQAVGDPAVPAGLATWFTERAFHFYLAGLRLPRQALARSGGKRLAAVCAELDAACSHLRRVDGMDSVIVTAQGWGALAAALWADSHRQETDRQQSGADALILVRPALPDRRRLRLSIDCPVLVLSQAPRPAASPLWRGWPARLLLPGQPTLHLGGHVTWLQLPAEPASEHAFFDELGRWLGAYMYRNVRDQLL